MHPQQPPPPGGGYDPIIGQTIGNYVVKQKLGEGGMGSVYLAEHPAIGKKVALKILHAEFAANNEVVGRFFNEARAVNDIQHPNIVDIVDYGVLTAGAEPMVYFIMEFLPGISLSELIRREAPLAPERALSIALQVADALAASHIKGIIHRDLKPDNIMLLQRGREKDFVKLLDFGIAKLTGDQHGSSRTRTGIVMGTPAYMSPEQCEGRGNIDHRTDIYALGIVIYEMITGRVPFVGEGYGEVLVQHLTQMPAAPSTIRGLIPPHVEQVVMKALEKRPEARYPNMDEMIRALADPVGYVEAHGGIAGFKNAVLTITQAPMPSQGATVRLTPSPLSPLTPVPGSVGAISQPGAPTTLGASAGQVGVSSSGSGKKIGIFIGIGVVVAAIAAAAVMLAGGGGGDDKKGDAVASNDTGSDKGSDSTDPKAGTGGSASSGTGASSASASGTGTASASGSGTASGTGKASSAGSGAASASASGAGTASASGAGTASASSAGSGAASASTGSGAGTASGTGTGTASGAGTASGTGAGSATAPVKNDVKISVESTPPGAFVFVNSEPRPRGKTPTSFEMPKGSGDVAIRLLLSNYKDGKQTVSTDGNQDVDLTLEKIHHSGGGGTHTGKGSGGDDSGDSDDTMNPFAKKKPK